MGGVTDRPEPADREAGERLLAHLVGAFAAYLAAIAGQAVA
jgi:hypothetical protein